MSSLSVQIVRGMALVGIVGVAVKLIALGKEMTAAAAFGAGPMMDAYLVALAVPAFALTVFPASFATALVPALVARPGDGPAREAIAFAITAGGVLSIVILAAGEPVLALAGYGFSDARFDQALELYRLLVPVFFFGCITSTLGAIANAAHRFVAPAATPAISVVVTVLAIWWKAADWGVTSIAVGLSVGLAIETAALASLVARAGLPWMPSWRGMTRRLRGVLDGARPLILSAALLGATTLVDQAMASALAPGDVAIFGYGTRLGAVVATSAGAVAVVCLPYFSSLTATRDWRGLRRTLFELTAVVAAASVPVVGIFVLASEPLIRLMFERGAFSAADTSAAAWVQTLFAFHIPFYVLANMALRGLAAFGRTAPTAWIGALFLIFNAAGNWILMQILGIAGIALATTLAYALASIVGYGWLLREIRRQRGAPAAAAQSSGSAA
jgi:putative peptidoglycan lipid II flippase